VLVVSGGDVVDVVLELVLGEPPPPSPRGGAGEN
jgi:hypothetical protein